MQEPCPYCGRQDTYTDPQYQVRCTGCFNHVAGTAGEPIGAMVNLYEPMVIRP
jgi:ribosomal protein S27E